MVLPTKRCPGQETVCPAPIGLSTTLKRFENPLLRRLRVRLSFAGRLSLALCQVAAMAIRALIQSCPWRRRSSRSVWTHSHRDKSWVLHDHPAHAHAHAHAFSILRSRVGRQVLPSLSWMETMDVIGLAIEYNGGDLPSWSDGQILVSIWQFSRCFLNLSPCYMVVFGWYSTFLLPWPASSQGPIVRPVISPKPCSP